jgi:hypothetical protein
MRRGRPKKMSDGTTLSKVGITRDQSSAWQRIAMIPDAEFEAMLTDKNWKPSTRGILERAGLPNKVRKCPHCGGEL